MPISVSYMVGYLPPAHNSLVDPFWVVPIYCKHNLVPPCNFIENPLQFFEINLQYYQAYRVLCRRPRASSTLPAQPLSRRRPQRLRPPASAFASPCRTTAGGPPHLHARGLQGGDPGVDGAWAGGRAAAALRGRPVPRRRRGGRGVARALTALTRAPPRGGPWAVYGGAWVVVRAILVGGG